MTHRSLLYGLTNAKLVTYATLFALFLITLTPACMDSGGNSDTSPEGGENTTQQALGIGCNSSSQCTIEAIAATDAPIAECMLDHGACQTLTDPVSGDSYSGCVALVDLACVGNLASDGTENCANGLDDDGDGDVDCSDLDCVGISCNDSNACTVGDYCHDGSCVGGATTPDPGPPASECFERSCVPATGWGATPLPAETECGEFDSECNVASYCDGTGVCVADTSTSSCCDTAYDCPSDLCNEWGDGWYRTCSEDILESDFGQCSCVSFGVEICYDGIDNDDDGLLDCADPECADNAAFCTASTSCCETSTSAGCSDFSDMLAVCIDLEDPYCCEVAWDSICVRRYDELNSGVCDLPTTETVCDDGLDDDFDGWIDCSDSDCMGTPACPMPDEVCNDEVDNDGDELTDCVDPDCTADPACAPATTEVWWCWSDVTACDPLVEPQVWSIDLPTGSTSIPPASVDAPFCTSGGAPTSELPDSGQCCRDGGGWPSGARNCLGTPASWSLLVP